MKTPLPHRRRTSNLRPKNQRGLSTVEYVILLAVIVVGAVSVWTSLGEHFKSALSNAENELRSLSK